MRRQNPDTDDDTQPIMVPRSERALSPASPERARRLRKHLVTALRALRVMQTPTPAAAPPPPEPVAFVTRVAQTACAMCNGWCCKGGGDHAYLDEQTLARVRAEQPELDARAVLMLYIRRLPQAGYQGSCVFHGEQGCTLPRSLRSDVCNAYFCAGLDAFITGQDFKTPAVVLAGEGGRMRTSRVLKP
jgi:hypothetical protein